MADSMRDRLERLKNSNPDFNFEPRKEEKLITPEALYMRKVEKAIQVVESLRNKMHSGTDQYLSLFHELKIAEAEFVAMIDDPETKFMDLPDLFLSRIENTKKKTKQFYPDGGNLISVFFFNFPLAFNINSIKNGIETIKAALSIFPRTATVTKTPPNKYVKLSPPNIFAGTLL